MKLYQAEGCPYCARVRSKMTDLGLTYVNINVARNKADRKELIEVSGQAGIPTLVSEDGKLIAADEEEIIAYLEERFGSGKR